MKKVGIIFCFIFFNLHYANAEIEIVYPASLNEGVYAAVKDLVCYLKKMGGQNVMGSCRNFKKCLL